MSKQNDERDRLEQLTEAFTNLPVPEGPGVEVKQQLLERLARASDEPVTIPLVPFWRSETMRKFASSAAVVLVVLGLVAYLQPLIGGNPRTVFAAMIEQIKEVRSATFTAQVRMDGMPDVTTHMSLLEPSWTRQETFLKEGKVHAIQIMNLREGVMLSLLPEQKQAIQLDLSNMPESQRQESIIESFKKIPEDAAEFVGEEEVEGVVAHKYKCDQQGASHYMVWLDPKTKMPVKILMTEHADPAQSKMHLTMSNFDWGAEVDESLFTLDIPEGYNLMEQSLDLGGSSEEDFTAMMRIYVRLNDDAFPGEWNLMTVVSIGKLMIKSEGTDEEKKQYAMQKLAHALDKPELADAANMSKEKQLELGMQLQEPLGRGAMFFANLIETHHWHYQGKGIKIGEADKIVAWWYPKKEKAEEGADLETAKVLYGDLRIETMPVAELPELEGEE